MKRIIVETVGFGTIREIQIEPGTTVEDVLKRLNLLSHVMGDFKNDDNLYDKVTDGQKVFAVSIALG